MRKFLPLFACLLISGLANAQCTTGYTQASLNWDNLDFLKQDPTYISASQAQIQYFAFGTNRVTITHDYNTSNEFGETNEHTAETGSNGAGDDVRFTGNGTITYTFQTPVENLKFSLYDVDVSQTITVASTQNITLSTVSGTALTINSNNLTTVSATASSAAYDNSSNGTLNVSITGLVSSVTITMSTTGTKNGNPKENGEFFLSDISACISTAAFPTSYYAISRPYTNQPGYVLSALNNSIYYINPANGAAKILFTDPSGNNINSLGYDPYNRFLYYCYSLTNTNGTVNTNNKSIQKYDVNTGLISTLVSNVNTLGIPTYTSGVESGGGAFYNGAFYIGIEGIDGDESKIWRIDFDGSGNPIIPARQVFAVITNDHDWSDFAISNGVLYDFDGKAGGNLENVYHINLQTGATNASYNSATLGFVPRQVAVDWTEKLYNTGAAVATSTGTIVPYANGAITTAQQYGLTSGATSPSGSWGDAAEAFKPKADFGDAPASFDPDPLAPAMHERDTALRLGNSFDEEWAKPTTLGPDADADGTDENGLLYTTLLNQNGSTYHTQVNVYNNTGATATLAGWVDFNNNGVFDAAEGITQTVNSSPTNQMMDLYWSGISNSLPAGTNVYLRIRITSASNTMTASSSTGYFGNGEVEDYKVVVNFTPLEVSIQSFDATKTANEKVNLSWKVTDEEKGTKYELERSADSKNWKTIYTNSVIVKSSNNYYEFVDENAVKPFSYYRIKFTNQAGNVKYTDIKKIQFTPATLVNLAPNPAKDKVYLQIDSRTKEVMQIKVFDMQGRNIHTQLVNVESGSNSFPLQFPGKLNNGLYSVQFILSNEQYMQKLIIKK